MLRFAHPSFEFQQGRGTRCLLVHTGLKAVSDS